MSDFNWGEATSALESFGGREKTLVVPKTGLNFFDVLRLYGAIELYLGLSGEVTITDAGSEWKAEGKARDNLLKSAKDAATVLNKGKALAKKEKTVADLALAVENAALWPTSESRNVSVPLDNPDSALKDGIRDHAARRYSGLATGEGESSKVAFADALLAFAGQERTQSSMSGLMFLPVFEGIVDYSRVVSPLRAWTNVSNVLCGQAIALLALKNALFAEGYGDQLSAVVFNTNLDGRKNTNYSGLIAIDSTAIGRKRELKPSFYGHCYRTFRSLVGRAWQSGKATGETEDAFAYVYWLMQPERAQHLGTLLTSVERQCRDRREHLLLERKRGEQPITYVKEIFSMSYNDWDGDHEAVHKLARAVSSGIYQTRQKKEKTSADQGKAWYDEVTMLRSAPTAKAFFERALILIEQGKREQVFIGTAAWNQDFDIEALRKSIGKDRRAFETFRDLFRMYLIQESTPRTSSAGANTAEPSGSDDSTTESDTLSNEGEI